MRGLGAVRALALLAVLAVPGCASMSEQECREGDWAAIGRADGERGARLSEIERYRKACARHEIPVGEEAWREGYAAGIAAFCTPKGGYVAGRGGQKHQDVCFGFEGSEKFMAAYGNGQVVHKLLAEIRALRRAKSDFDMAALSGEYPSDELMEIRRRAAEIEAARQRREWELEELDKRYCAEYGAPPLTRADYNR